MRSARIKAIESEVQRRRAPLAELDFFELHHQPGLFFELAGAAPGKLEPEPGERLYTLGEIGELRSAGHECSVTQWRDWDGRGYRGRAE